MIPFQTPAQPPATPKFYIDSVNPPTIVADGESYQISINGAGFKGDSTVSVSGAGVTVSSVQFVSDKILIATMVAAVGAATTSRSITVTRGVKETTAVDALTVVAPIVEVIDLFSISPGQLQQGTTQQFIISGDAIDTGVLVTISGAGVTANVISSTHTSITVDITATGGAAVGFRNVTATNPSLDTDTLTGVLEITAAPVIPPDDDFVIDQAWLDFYDPTGQGPWYLDQADSVYRLDVDVTVNKTAFAVIAQNVTLNLDGHTITYNNAASVNPANNGFENALAGTWDLTNAPNADRFDGEYLENQVHLGSYSLRIQVPCPDQYVESVGTVTLLPNTKYSFSGMLQRGSIKTGGVDDPNAIMYCELVGTGSEPTRRFQKTNGNNRGIQFTDTTFTTGPSSETYKVRCGISGASGVDARSIYFDDIRILQVYNYGFLVGVNGTILSSLSDGTVTRTGNGGGFTITGTGSILQGQGAGRECSPILFGAGSNCVVSATVDDGITALAHGPMTKTFWTQSGGDHIFRNLLFISNVLTVRSRDQFDASVIGNNGYFEVDNCTFMNFAHAAIRSGTSNASHVHDCFFQAKNRFTNGFCIGIRGPGSIVEDNVIQNTGIYNGRGIFVEGTATAGMIVRNNIIEVQTLPFNQEYGQGSFAGALIAYGIQCENSDSVEIYGNTVTAYGDQGEASALRLNNNPDTLYIHDNILIADQLTLGVQVQCVHLTNLHGDLNNRFEDNELRTNKNFVGETDNVDSILWERTLFTLLGTPSVDARFFESISSATNESQKIGSWVWLDNSYTDAPARAAVENGSWRLSGGNGYGRWDQYSVAWTTTVRVMLAGNPVPGAPLTVEDVFATEVFNGVTDGSGQRILELTEFTVAGSTINTTIPATKTEYSDYTAASGVDSTVFTADQIQTVDVVT